MTPGAVTPLLLPGTLCDAALWGGVRLPPGARTFPVVCGASLPDAARQVLAYAGGPLHLVGFSLGAIVAFEVLRQAPGRVRALTLVSATGHAPRAAQLETWAAQRQQVQAGAFDEVAGALTRGPHQATLWPMARRVGPGVFVQQLGLLASRPDSRGTLATWAGPLGVLAGEHDTVTRPALSVELHSLVPHARLDVVPGAGHYLPLDAPGRVSAMVQEAAYA